MGDIVKRRRTRYTREKEAQHVGSTENKTFSSFPRPLAALSCAACFSRPNRRACSQARVYAKRASSRFWQNRNRISSVGTALDCRAGGRGLNSLCRTNIQGLKIADSRKFPSQEPLMSLVIFKTSTGQ